jgi:hypothetical protein
MSIPTSKLFFLMLLFAAFGTAIGYWIRWRVSRAGFRVKAFATIHDTIGLFRTYRQIAPSRGWSLWPIVSFWVCGTAMFALGFIFFLTGGLSNPTTISIRISPALILIWVSVGSLFLALWFTYRVIWKTPRLETGRRNWGHLLRDEYVRSDLYLVSCNLGVGCATRGLSCKAD